MKKRHVIAQKVHIPLVIIALLLIAGALYLYTSLGKIIFFPETILGAVLIAGGFTMSAWAYHLFKKHKLNIKPADETAEIITYGPFELTRNPMYLGITLMLLGLGFLVGTLPFFFPAILFFVIMNFIYIPFEEDKIVKAHGEKYHDYKKKVRRWL
ncbi:isoprenylcysteine carboxylmethyltransferase family protein [Candidatus Peregrinibacteria bacterium]|nr:isoprenylcysteine carboxylmethyltransferase family protein [Candidatus Peregrinibacteria bacterium]